MGKLLITNDPPFTMKDVRNKSLVMEMLQYEESLIKSPVSQNKFRDPQNNARTSLMLTYAFHRDTLLHFS